MVKSVTVSPLIHNGRIIQLKINSGENDQYEFILKDSYLILLSSLAKLGKSFQVKTLKSIFPHFFVNKDNLNYIGEIHIFIILV